MPPHCYAIDSNIFDLIADTDGAMAVVADLTSRGVLELVVTPVQEEEIAAVRDAARRARLQSIPRTVLPRTSSILGELVLGEALLGTSGRITSAKRDNDNDESIAGEARQRGLTLVTADKPLSRNATTQGVSVIDWHDFWRLVQQVHGSP